MDTSGAACWYDVKEQEAKMCSRVGLNTTLPMLFSAQVGLQVLLLPPFTTTWSGEIIKLTTGHQPFIYGNRSHSLGDGSWAGRLEKDSP